MIFAYNKEHVGDVLMIVVADDQGKENKVERNGQVARISLAEKPEQVVAWNIFQASELIGSIEGRGQVELTEEQIEGLNEAIRHAGFVETVVKDQEPKIVVGFVKSCKKHPDSDHLSITQTEVDNGEILQIVCGAPNIKAGQKVVVAKPGAMMPDGLLIWPGFLRGVASYGMICSAKELRLPNAPTKKGILELSFDAEVGKEYPVNH